MIVLKQWIDELISRLRSLWYSDPEPAEIMSAICALAVSMTAVFASDQWVVGTNIPLIWIVWSGALVCAFQTYQLLWGDSRSWLQRVAQLSAFFFWLSLGVAFLHAGSPQTWIYFPLAQATFWAYLRYR